MINSLLIYSLSIVLISRRTGGFHIFYFSVLSLLKEWAKDEDIYEFFSNFTLLHRFIIDRLLCKYIKSLNNIVCR